MMLRRRPHWETEVGPRLWRDPGFFGALLIAIALFVGACAEGGASDRTAEPQDRPSSPESAQSPDSATEPGGEAKSGDSAAPADDAGGPVEIDAPGASDGPDAPVGSESRGQPAEPELRVSITFAADCVAPGESQTITIRSEPETAVAYHATYDDGSTFASEDYPGGNNGGVTDAEGAWEDTWVVGPAATPGPVRVVVIARAEGQGVQRDSTFDVADESGECR